MSRLPTKHSVSKIVTENVAKEARLFTDESRLYFGSDQHFADPSDGQAFCRANTCVATFIRIRLKARFSIFKRGMKGVYQHCKEKHLHRYLAEFDFRYNHRTGLGYSDIDRTFAAIRGVEGKRLMYRQPH